MLIAGASLVIGCFPLGYSYYGFLDGVVSLAAYLLVFSAFRLKEYAWCMLALPSFFLWFPLFEVHLDKKTWIYADLVFGILYLTVGFVFMNKGETDDKIRTE